MPEAQSKQRECFRPPFTPNPVPFALRPLQRDGEFQWFEESGRPRDAIWIAVPLGVVTIPLFAICLIGAFKSAPIRDGLLLLAIGIVAWSFIAFLLLANRWRRQLVMHGPTETVRLLDLKWNRRIRREVSGKLEEWSLLTHPVHLTVLTRPMTLHWSGFAAVVHFDEERFVLACLKGRAELDQFRASLPAWLRLIDSGEGPLIEAHAQRKLF